LEGPKTTDDGGEAANGRRNRAGENAGEGDKMIMKEERIVR
jgi:hypothetical protein